LKIESIKRRKKKQILLQQLIAARYVWQFLQHLIKISDPIPPTNGVELQRYSCKIYNATGSLVLFKQIF
jgi:hypothetical protein